MPKSKRPLDPRLQNQKAEIRFDNQPCVSGFVSAIAGDQLDKPEIACFGTRGDGKTIGALTGMIFHAQEHQRLGFRLPVRWMGVTDTFQAHRLKTIRSMENPIWKGMWKLEDGDHTAIAVIDGVRTVAIDLFGIEDIGAMDRVRMETTGVWFEEPAPSAVLVQSNGVSLDAWNLAFTSRRIDSYFKPAIITANYPDEDHWTWERFVSNPQPGTRYIRVTPGERASAEDRADWDRALAGRPDLKRRLLDGMPGVVMIGDQVAKGFRRDRHTTKEIKPLMPGDPLIIGADFWHSPTCVIGQQQNQTLLVKAALSLEGFGMKQLMEEQVMPWLSRFAPWTLRDPDQMFLVGYDPTGATPDQSNIDNSALIAMQDELGGGLFERGPTRWEPRREALVNSFTRYDALIIEDNQYTQKLLRALDGRWYAAKSHQGELRSDKPRKPNHPWEDLGDAFCYFLIRAGMASAIDNRQEIKVNANLTPAYYRG